MKLKRGYFFSNWNWYPRLAYYIPYRVNHMFTKPVEDKGMTYLMWNYNKDTDYWISFISIDSTYWFLYKVSGPCIYVNNKIHENNLINSSLIIRRTQIVFRHLYKRYKWYDINKIQIILLRCKKAPAWDYFKIFEN